MRHPLHAASVAIPLLGAVCGQSYDYIVVGGGTAGLAVATRLAQSKDCSVAVLEAGGTGAGNTGITIPGLAGSTIGTEIDWAYAIEPQRYADNITEIYPRGKVLGGSSAINLMINSKASVSDYNAIEALNNPGWGYAELSAAMKKVENLVVPTQDNYTYVKSDHGTFGPVDSTFPISPPEQFGAYLPSAETLGHPVTIDAFGGNATGVWIYPSAINVTDPAPTRVTSNTAYYSPNAFLPNLHVFTNAYVTTLQTETTNTGLRVTGIQYVPANATYATPQNLTASKEVVLSAGTIETPAILERSGIGSKELLSSLKIETILDLPAVGNNLADHACTLATYKLKPGYASIDNLSDHSFLEAALGDYAAGTGILTGCASVLDYETMANLFNASDIAEGYALLNGTTGDLTQQEYETVVNNIKTGNAVEYLLLNTFFENDVTADPDQSYISLAICIQHPLSRGSVHISSSDPTVAPKVDPNYWAHPFDLWLASKAAQYGRRLMAQAAWEDIIKEEQYPGLSVQTDSEWLETVRRRVRTEFHPIGTASMKPQSSGGVVDSKLLVYGTTNLRIVDASIIPIHLATHIALTVYGIAELAADIILS